MSTVVITPRYIKLWRKKLLAGPKNTILYVKVDDIAASLKRAASLGAKTVKPKTEIPGGHGFYAHFRAPDGNRFGIYNAS